ncbi:hypothetical protein BV898_14824 [Hypsibius exemplaris]|uniref:Uncharacterized protein n=1 Tax=Hypsibius exemplaris TaxID=2072580 RepID=A0A9X6NCV8_HYPEX|nr:hypothetical protein BV898_14824 [Hypsibius exemplaris]
MEAYDKHLNKLKVPDVALVEPHPDSGFVDSTLSSIIATEKSSTADVTVKDDSIRVAHPRQGEFVEERVQTVIHHSSTSSGGEQQHHHHHDYYEPNTPDLTRKEAIISSESSASSGDEHEVDLESGERKKKSKVKKVKSKLVSGLKKIFGKKEHHDEDSHHHEVELMEEQHHHHMTHVSDDGLAGDHKHPRPHIKLVSSASPADAVPNYVKLERQTVTTSSDTSSPGGPSSRSPSSRDENIQAKLTAAFTMDGQNVARDRTDSFTRNRLADIQDHSKKSHPAVDFPESSNIGIFGSEKYSNPVAVSANPADIPILHTHGMGEFSQLRRESIDRTLTKRPSIDISSPFESLPVRPEAGHVKRSSEEWDLSPSGVGQPNEPKLILKDVEEHGKAFSEKFLITKRPSVDLTPHFENVAVRPEAGHLIRSSEEWDLSPATLGRLNEPKLILEDVQRHGQAFSEKFQKVGGHRNSLTGMNSLPAVEPVHFHALEEDDRLPHSAPLPAVPPIPIVEKIHDPGYERRLSIAREKWSLPVEDRANALVSEVMAVSGAPPTGQVDHFVREKRSSPVVSERLIREDKSVAALSDFERGGPAEQTFERVSSDDSFTKKAGLDAALSAPASHISPPHIDLSSKSESVSNTITEVPRRERLDVVAEIERHTGKGFTQSQTTAESRKPTESTQGLSSESHVSNVSLPTALGSSIDMLSDSHEVNHTSTERLRRDNYTSDDPITDTGNSEVVVDVPATAQRGVLNTVVESVAGAVGSVIGIFQAKTAEANATEEDEYLPFEVKEHSVDSNKDAGEGSEEPKSFVDTVIDNVITLLTGKEQSEPAVVVEETLETKPKAPPVLLPITGEFVAFYPTDTVENLSTTSVSRSHSIQQTVAGTTLKTATTTSHPALQPHLQ